MEEVNLNEPKLPVDSLRVREFNRILDRYRAGRATTQARIIASENWWKLRNSAGESDTARSSVNGFVSRSAWLHNVIVSKHADGMEAYPQPMILPREPSDTDEAQMLSSIIPCILEQNHFEQVYSAALWQKLKTGTGVYKVVWDSQKLGGMGDIAVEGVNLLNLFWEPGITDIQSSRYLFHIELTDYDLLCEEYPDLDLQAQGRNMVVSKFMYDDTVDTSDKVAVVEVYYHVGKRLQYCKYVGETVLYASENDPLYADWGWYDHGQYPYVFDPLYPIEGSPCGYGYVDLCKNPQTQIDLLNTAFLENAMVGAKPRYFTRSDASFNRRQFLDTTQPLVDVTGNLDEKSLRRIDYQPLDGVYMNVLESSIRELRETSGNTETSTGNYANGVTAASAIAALQEASGKTSRDATRSAYRAFGRIVEMCIELMRQFYDAPRRFRITGTMGENEFVSYSNAHLVPHYQGEDFGIDLGYRSPVFDIKVKAHKENAYTTMSQNELAMELFRQGFFNPQLTEQALSCLELMEFEGKDRLVQRLTQQSATPPAPPVPRGGRVHIGGGEDAPIARGHRMAQQAVMP